MLFLSKATRTERALALVEVVVDLLFRLLLSGVLGLDAMILLILLSWCRLCFVRGKRWEEACEDSELEKLSVV